MQGSLTMLLHSFEVGELVGGNEAHDCRPPFSTHCPAHLLTHSFPFHAQMTILPSCPPTYPLNAHIITQSNPQAQMLIPPLINSPCSPDPYCPLLKLPSPLLHSHCITISINVLYYALCRNSFVLYSCQE